MAYSDYIISPAISIYDIQEALSDGSPDLGHLSVSANINPMAKFKPVRFNKKEALTAQDFFSVRYGLRPWATTSGSSGVEISTFASNNPNPNVAWIYDKPRGRRTGYTDEHYRQTDFNHYFHRATPPFAFEVSGELGSSIGITFYIDALAATINSQNMGLQYGWHPEYNLSMNDMFSAYYNPSAASHLCVCMHNLDKNSYCAVILKLTVGDLSASASTAILFAKQTTLSGVTYPAVPFIDDLTESGDNFRFIIGLTNSYTAGNDPYQVVTTAIDCYPLAFVQGIDRRDIQLWSYITIHGLKSWFANVAGNLSGEYIGRVTYADRQYDKYRITGDLYGMFMTPSDHWAAPGVTAKINIRTQGLVGDNTLESVGVPVNLPDAGTSYQQRLVQFGASATEVFVYIEPAADTRTLEFIGRAEYAYEQGQNSVPFENRFVVKLPSPQ